MSPKENTQIKMDKKQSFAHTQYAEPAEISPIVNEVLHSPGQSLDASTRTFIEPGFGHEFGQVRVHTDSRATESARMLNANAFTIGNHIIFAQGLYTPGSTQGKKLLAHELTHVIQQTQYPHGWSDVNVVHPSHPSETEAARTAADVANGGYAGTISSQPLTLQRQGSGTDIVDIYDPKWAPIVCSVTIDGFVTAKADISTENEKKLKRTANYIVKVLQRYPGSTVRVIGHTDAIDTEEYNQELGMKRAESTRDALKKMGVPEAAIKIESKGESQLWIDTKLEEPQNRRVEVRFEPYILPGIGGRLKLDVPPLTPPQVIPPSLKPRPKLYPPLMPPYQPWSQPGIPPYAPYAPKIQKHWLEELLKKDPLLKTLPEDLKKKAINALKDADEMAADKIIDLLPMDSKYKEAFKAAVKSVLQMLKGKRYKPPTPSPYGPFSPPQRRQPWSPYKAPGEKIFPLWEWKF